MRSGFLRGQFCVWQGPTSWCISSGLFTVTSSIRGVRKLSQASYKGINLMKTVPSWLNQFPKAPLPNSITLGSWDFNIWILRGHPKYSKLLLTVGVRLRKRILDGLLELNIIKECFFPYILCIIIANVIYNISAVNIACNSVCITPLLPIFHLRRNVHILYKLFCGLCKLVTTKKQKKT